MICDTVSVYYTGKGDDGTTGLLARGRVHKGEAIIDAIGSVDELNSSIGIALFYIHDDLVRLELKLVQNELFVIGANLASVDEKKVNEARVNADSIVRIEGSIKSLGDKMPPLNKFVLPGGSEGTVHLHLSRSVARRAERDIARASKAYKVDKVVGAYINRLSSFLFVAALYLNYMEGIKEENPTY